MDWTCFGDFKGQAGRQRQTDRNDCDSNSQSERWHGLQSGANIYLQPEWSHVCVWTSANESGKITLLIMIYIVRPPHEPQPSYPAPQGWLATPSTPLSCGMASCWQINSILANSGRKNSIQIWNNESVFQCLKTVLWCFNEQDWLYFAPTPSINPHPHPPPLHF